MRKKKRLMRKISRQIDVSAREGKSPIRMDGEREIYSTKTEEKRILQSNGTLSQRCIGKKES